MHGPARSLTAGIYCRRMVRSWPQTWIALILTESGPLTYRRFVHERGMRTALWNLAFMAGISIGPLIAGQLIQRYSWRVCSYGMSAALVVNILLVFFFVPETAYHTRTITLDTASQKVSLQDTLHVYVYINSYLKHTDGETKNTVEHHETALVDSRTMGTAACQDQISTRKTFREDLALWSGYRYPAPFFRSLLRPLKMAGSPIVLWSSIVFMTAIVWLVILTVVASQIFASPPYNFSIASVGNVFLSSFIASILGTIAAKPLIDGGVRFLARKNRGIFGKSLALFQGYIVLD